MSGGVESHNFDGKLGATAELSGNETARGEGELSFTNEFGVFTCLQVTRLRCSSISE